MLNQIENVEIIFDQALHGYSQGHTLLSSSNDFSFEDEKLMLLLSDMSGSSMISGFEEYLTGYPLPHTNSYVIAKTWYAPEMKRPGCVWTHSLIIKNSDLIFVDNHRELEKLFTRPKSGMYQKYEKPVKYKSKFRDIKLDSGRNTLISQFAIVGNYLYENATQNLFIPADKSAQYQELVSYLWSSQWPGLRSNISFCTGSIEDRTTNKIKFDLQIIPKNEYERIRIKKTDSIIVELNHSSFGEGRPDWVYFVEKQMNDKMSRIRMITELDRWGDSTTNHRDYYHHFIRIYKDILFPNSSLVDALTSVLSDVGKSFPSKNDGTQLKQSILGLQGKTRGSLFKKVNEAEILKALSLSSNPNAFDEIDLEIKNRTKKLYKIMVEEAIELANELIVVKPNSIIDEYLDGISEVIDVKRLQILSKKDRQLFLTLLNCNPSIATRKLFWEAPIDDLRERFDTIIESPNLSKKDYKTILIYVLELGDFEIIRYITKTSPSESIPIFLEWFSKQIDSSQLFSYPYLVSDLSNFKIELIKWLRTSKTDNLHFVNELVSLLDPDDKIISVVDLDVWLRFLKLAQNSKEFKNQQNLLSFCLAIALNSYEEIAGEIFAHSFSPIYNLQSKSMLKHENWKIFSDKLPRLSVTARWDKCARLRQGLVDQFIKKTWEIRHFVNAMNNDDAFHRVAKLAYWNSEANELMVEIKNKYQTGQFELSKYQQSILSDHIP